MEVTNFLILKTTSYKLAVTGGKLSRNTVNKWKQKMLDGDFDSAKDAIGGYKNTKNGKVFINEGNHRIQAAKEIFEETGDKSFVDDLLKNGNFKNRTDNPVDNFPLNNVGK